MIGFVARTSIPFGPLTVTFGYGPYQTYVPPVPPGPTPPPEILDLPGPSFSPQGTGQKPSRFALRPFIPVTQTTSAITGRLGRYSTTSGVKPTRRVTPASAPVTGTTGVLKGRRVLTGSTPRAPRMTGVRIRKKRG